MDGDGRGTREPCQERAWRMPPSLNIRVQYKFYVQLMQNFLVDGALSDDALQMCWPDQYALRPGIRYFLSSQDASGLLWPLICYSNTFYVIISPSTEEFIWIGWYSSILREFYLSKEQNVLGVHFVFVVISNGHCQYLLMLFTYVFVRNFP